MLNSEATKAVDYKMLAVSSPAFMNETMIPRQYTCDGINVSPPINVGHIPEKTKCLAMIVDDPDAPFGAWVHWVVWSIPVTHHLKENEIHGIQGINDFGWAQYTGPCPPSGTHHYYFKVYALDTLLDLPPGSSKAALEKAMGDHIIAFGQLTGIYKRIK
jgi:Raf kinase inhibitor-like YbhB/YbcL family protein